MPDGVNQLSEVLNKLAERREWKAALPALRMSDMVASFCSLRAAMASTACVLSPEIIIARALSINAEFTAWRIALPQNLLYDTVIQSEPDATAHTCYYYTWSNLGSAVLHVTSWMTLVLLHGAVIQQIGILQKEKTNEPDGRIKDYESQIKQSTRLILSLIDHICASVRYYLSLCSADSPVSPTSSIEPSTVRCAAPINAILKPLFVAGDSSLCPPTIRAWTVEQLRNIGTTMGVKQALYLADGIVRGASSSDLLLDDRVALVHRSK